MELNFVFLRVGAQYQVATKQSTGLFFPNQRFGATVSFAVRNSLPRAKNEKTPKNSLDSMSKLFFNPSGNTMCCHLPLHKGGSIRFVQFYFRRGSDHFIDSLKPSANQTAEG